VSILSTSPYSGTPVNLLEESISMVERTSFKIYPIIREVLKRTIKEKQMVKLPDGTESLEVMPQPATGSDTLIQGLDLTEFEKATA
jgi:hypothetical protein